MLEHALAASRGVVDKSLEQEHRPGISAEALYGRYMSFGDDPFVVVLDGADDSAEFSTWSYAKACCPRDLRGAPGRIGAMKMFLDAERC